MVDERILTNWQEKEGREDEYNGSWLFRVIDQQRRKHAAEVQTRNKYKLAEQLQQLIPRTRVKVSTIPLRSRSAETPCPDRALQGR